MICVFYQIYFGMILKECQPLWEPWISAVVRTLGINRYENLGYQPLWEPFDIIRYENLGYLPLWEPFDINPCENASSSFLLRFKPFM